MTISKRVALVTGGNRGIGFEVCRQLGKQGIHVILTSRSEERGAAAVEKLKKDGLSVSYRQLDVTDIARIHELGRVLNNELDRLDILVNNAGIFLDHSENEDGATAFHADPEVIRRSFETNTLGPFLLCQQLIPVMKKNGYGRVVNLSSGMGQLGEMNGGYPGYRISKTALNAVTRIFADETSGSDILVNSVCPGWVKTDMGGEEAERGVEEGADTVVWLATLPPGGPTGGFFRDRKPIAW